MLIEALIEALINAPTRGSHSLFLRYRISPRARGKPAHTKPRQSDIRVGCTLMLYYREEGMGGTGEVMQQRPMGRNQFRVAAIRTEIYMLRVLPGESPGRPLSIFFLNVQCSAHDITLC